MKESDITQPVIDKCKQIAELWRMDIEKFGWFSLDCDLSPFNLDNYNFWKEGEDIHQVTHDLLNPNQVTIFTKREWFPIPSISDCESRLEDLGWGYDSRRLFPGNKVRVQVHTIPTFNTPQLSKQIFIDKSLHLALLSALLEALKGVSDE